VRFIVDKIVVEEVFFSASVFPSQYHHSNASYTLIDIRRYRMFETDIVI
jgi:hypothetical protein